MQSPVHIIGSEKRQPNRIRLRARWRPSKRFALRYVVTEPNTGSGEKNLGSLARDRPKWAPSLPPRRARTHSALDHLIADLRKKTRGRPAHHQRVTDLEPIHTNAINTSPGKNRERPAEIVRRRLLAQKITSR